MITYNKYMNGEDYTWYDSSNVLFSKCYDNNNEEKTVKIVFKEGRTYVYKGVNVMDYLAFKSSQSNGSAVNKHIIKKYKGVRISDTDLGKLAELKEGFINGDKEIDNEVFSNLDYHIDLCDKTGEFQLKLNGKTIYTAVEGQVSIVNLLKSMNIKYSWAEVDKIENNSDENKEEITLQ